MSATTLKLVKCKRKADDPQAPDFDTLFSKRLIDHFKRNLSPPDNKCATIYKCKCPLNLRTLDKPDCESSH